MVTYTDFKPFAARMMSVFFRYLTDIKPLGVKKTNYLWGLLVGIICIFGLFSVYYADHGELHRFQAFGG